MPLLDQIKAAVATLNDTTTPVGLAIEVENGAGMPIRLRQGQRFFINQVDI